jgi:hypothetical protein
MKETLFGEKRTVDIIRFFEAPDSITKQSAGIAQIKKRKALGNTGLSVILIVLGVLASIYGIADVFGGKTLPMGVLFLIGGPIAVVGGIIMLFSSLGRAATASQVRFETDLVKLCTTFYSNAFCKRTTDLGSKDNQLVDVCDFIPVIVLDSYKDNGWDKFLGKPKPHSGGTQIECTRCNKKAEHNEINYTSIPVSTKYREEYRNKESGEVQNLINNLYLKCKSCGTVVCYECMRYFVSKELRYLCPTCGKATNGWDGLGERWINLRNGKSDQDVDFSLASINVEQSSRSDSRIVDITIQLNGTPFGRLLLYNVAFNIGGKWFLGTPEPLLS